MDTLYEFKLQNELQTKFKEALDKTMKVAWDNLKDIIQQDVYDRYNPKWYQRTNELLNNWEYFEPKALGLIVDSKLSFTKQISHSGYPFFNHGISQIDNNTFANIINGEYNIGKIANFPLEDELNRNPFWDDFKKWCNDNFEEEFEKQCNELGLPITLIQHSEI